MLVKKIKLNEMQVEMQIYTKISQICFVNC